MFTFVNMKTININSQEHVKFVLYPDNQPHIKLVDVGEEEVKVVCSITDSVTLIHLLEVSNALDHVFAKKKVLAIPYLMGARFDRVMETGDSFDLQVIANLINSCGFEKVLLYDVHSDVSTALIRNSVNIDNFNLIQSWDIPGTILICPDAGAAKKMDKYMKWNKNFVDVSYCIKKRDLRNGDLSLNMLEPDKCYGEPCLIVDDLCDGGGTFLAIAEQIQPSSLCLMVTHGIFSKGFATLEKWFNEIIVSDSYARAYESKIVNLVKCPLW